jgi:hypothetical protein
MNKPGPIFKKLIEEDKCTNKPKCAFVKSVLLSLVCLIQPCTLENGLIYLYETFWLM